MNMKIRPQMLFIALALVILGLGGLYRGETAVTVAAVTALAAVIGKLAEGD